VNNLERRYVSDSIEMRGLPGQGAVLAGHAAVFNQEAVIWDFRETIAPGAFKKTIKEADIRGLFNHDPNHVLGRNRAKTLRLSEDDAGLSYEIDLPDTQFAIDLAKSIERGDVSQSSFSFATVKDAWQYPKKEEGGMPLRTIIETKLYDVSPVTFPAYEGTDVDLQRALRSLALDLSRPLDELVAAAREGRLFESTQEPEAEPREHSEATQEPDWKAKARKELQLAEYK
jgi:HK97 family phage prohead protease